MLTCLLGWTGLIAIAQAAEMIPYDAPIPGAVSSYYSDKIIPVIKNWPRAEIPTDPKQLEPIWMRAVHRLEQEFHVGVIKRMRIHAPLARVEALLDDFSNYFTLFPSLKSLEITKREGNFLLTEWEHRSPLFFLPNARYVQAYILDKRDPNRRIYRYQLVKGNFVEYTDGFFALERVDDQTTLFTGYDFFMPDIGPLKILGSTKVWKEGTEGSFKGDMALKLKSENPSWDRDKLKEETEKLLERHPVHPLKEIESGPFARTLNAAPAKPLSHASVESSAESSARVAPSVSPNPLP